MRTGWWKLAAALVLAGCSDGRTLFARDAGGDAGPDAADSGCRTCEPGTAYCHDPGTLAVCNPLGTCHVLRPCAGTADAPQACDADSATCRPRVCDPGAFLECRDAKTSRQCNESGTEVVDVACDGCLEEDAAVPCICREPGPEGDDGGCAPVTCRPGDWACMGDEERHQCSDDGTRWILRDDCNDGRAALCEEEAGPDGRTARCVPLCEADRKTRSYLGCEYWAADLDNFHGTGPFEEAQSKPYAVVVSNATEGSHTARVEAHFVDGAVWCKPWADVGPPVPHRPDYRWCYLSEEECETGPRTIYIRTGEQDAVATEVPHSQGGGSCAASVPVPAGELRVLYLPRRDVSNTVLAPLAYRITSDVPLTAYQFNPLENVLAYTNDASLLLPIHALGKHYRVMSREQTSRFGRPWLTVVAVRPGETNVVVETAAPTLGGQGIPGLEAGQRRTFVLHQFDVLNLVTNCSVDAADVCRDVVDPTGSQVLADRLVAVFGGSQCSFVPHTSRCEAGLCRDGSECDDQAGCDDQTTCCCDHLEQQMFPVAAWGQRYVAARSHRRGEPIGTGLEPDVWRILASSEDTEVLTIPHQVEVPVLGPGEWFEFESQEDFEIQASRAVLVGQYLAGEHSPGITPGTPGNAGTGDPAFILAVPEEQYRDDYVVLAPDMYEHDFVNVVAPVGAAVTIDGVEIPADRFTAIADGSYAVARLPVDDGVHRIRGVPPQRGSCQDDGDCRSEGAGWECRRDEGAAPDDPGTCTGPAPRFGVVVYGYDRYVSYGYPGGLNLARVNECTGDRDCPADARCCRPGMECAAESLGECVPR